ncbi:hypothetical protein LINPERPRIM_LOCUS38092 [Linum perenne]
MLELGLASVSGLALELVYWSEHTNQPPRTSKGSSYEYDCLLYNNPLPPYLSWIKSNNDS